MADSMPWGTESVYDHLQNEQTMIPGTVCWSNDLTRLSECLKALPVRDQETVSQYLLRNPEATTSLLKEIRTISVSSALCELLGAGSQEQLLSLFRSLILPESTPLMTQFMDAVLAGVQRHFAVLLLHSLNGRVLHVEVNSTLELTGDRLLEHCVVSKVIWRTSTDTELERLRVIRSLALKAGSFGCWQWDIFNDRLIIDSGARALLRLASTKDEIRATDNLCRVHAEDLSRCHPMLESLRSGELPEFQIECRFLDAEECWRWYQIRGRIFGRNAEGLPSSLIGTLHDIDDSKKSEQLLGLEREALALADSMNSLDQSMAHLASGIERIWPGVRCAINLFDTSVRSIRVSAAPSMPEDYFQTVNNYRLGSFPTVCETAATTRRCCFADNLETDSQFQKAGEMYKRWNARACWSIPAIIANGDVVATLCLMFEQPRTPRPSEQTVLERVSQTLSLIVRNDLSERQRRLLESRIQFREKLESLGRLAGGIAHDFNNLLTVIAGHAEVLRDSRPGDRDVQFSADRILDASQLAADLCKQMVTFAGRSGNVFQAVDLSRVVNEVCNLLRTSLRPGIVLQTSIPAAGSLILGDRSMLSQVIINLITNATEAIRSSKGQIHVRLSNMTISRFDRPELYDSSLLADGQHACLEVTDTGQGIAPAEMRRLFEPFFTTKETGKGLGLATVMGIVKRHHGGISVSSTEGAGTAFRVYLPITAKPEPEPLAPPRVSRTVFEQPPTGGPSDQPRILLVDDDDFVRNSLAMMLRHDGHQVETFTGGSELLLAIPQIRDDDLILLDQHMPGILGTELLIQLREHSVNNPVCFLSGYTGDLRQQVRENDTLRVLEKPVTIARLRETIRAMQSHQTSSRN